MNCFARVCCCGELWAEPFCWFLVFKGHWRTLKAFPGDRKIAWGDDPSMFQSKGPQTARSIICARMWKVYGALSLDERLRSVPQSAAIFHVQPAASALIIRSSQNPSESVRICEDLQGSPTTREEGPEGHGSSCPAAQLCPAMPSYAQPSSQARVEVDRGEAGAWMRWREWNKSS